MLRFSFLLLFAPLALADDPPAATIDGEAIRLAEVDALLARLKPAGPRTGAETRRLREAALEELIGEKLLERHLAKHTKAPDAKEIDRHLEALAEAQKLRGSTMKQFQRETGFSDADLRRMFETDLRLGQYFEKQLSDDACRKYFSENLTAFDGSRVRLSHILLRLGSAATVAEENAARETLRLLKAEIEAGRIAFADAAKKHSAGPTARQGGDLGAIRRRDGLVDEPIAAAAFALKPFQLSEPIRSLDGLHLIMVTERTPGRALTYEQCREAAREALQERLREELAAKLRAGADVRILLP